MNAAKKEGRREISISVCDRRDWLQVSAQWAKLFAQSGASFFLSDRWVTTWLDVFGEQLEPKILLFRLEQDAEPVGACLLVRSVSWLGFIPVRRVYLNCAGESEADSTCIEYNRLLCLPGYQRDVASALQRHLQEDSWDELMLDGFEPHEGTEDLCQGAYRQQITQKPCCYVDLAAMRREGVTYEKILSQKARKQIRRCIRQYETAGTLSLERADSVSEALRFLEELADLHQKSWVSRGKAGAFSSAKFRRFHQQLVEWAFPEGHIELVRVLAGGRSIGVLYSFLHEGRIYFYQCGFAYEDKTLSPGLVTHFLAVQYYLARPDVSEYDFMAGDSLYKRSLGKSQRTLEWRVAQRATLGVKSIEALRALRDRYRALRKRDGLGLARPLDEEQEQVQSPPQDSDS
jgi:CelD/BcsL family acetyltransferase involved in cellulose biosynthesis